MLVSSRRSTRLPDFDYTTTGAYFVTICTADRACLFGDIVDGEMRLNGLGEVVRQTWDVLPGHFPRVVLDQFVIMPNHVHGIVVLRDIDDIVGTQFIAPEIITANGFTGAINRAPTVGEVVRGFKARCTYAINLLRDTPGQSVWQRNYYEHVIRGDRDLVAIRDYIAGNPARWLVDDNYPGVPALS